MAKCANCRADVLDLYHRCQPEDVAYDMDVKRFRFLCDQTVELFSFGGDPEEIRTAIDAAMARVAAGEEYEA